MKPQSMRSGQDRQAITQVGIGGNAPCHYQGSHAGALGLERRDRISTTILKNIADSAVPMSLLGDHPNVQFNFYRGGIGTCAVEMH